MHDISLGNPHTRESGGDDNTCNDEWDNLHHVEREENGKNYPRSTIHRPETENHHH